MSFPEIRRHPVSLFNSPWFILAKSRIYRVRGGLQQVTQILLRVDEAKTWQTHLPTFAIEHLSNWHISLKDQPRMTYFKEKIMGFCDESTINKQCSEKLKKEVLNKLRPLWTNPKCLSGELNISFHRIDWLNQHRWASGGFWKLWCCFECFVINVNFCEIVVNAE